MNRNKFLDTMRSINEYAEEMVELLFDQTGSLGRYDLFTLPKLLYRFQEILSPLESRVFWVYFMRHDYYFLEELKNRLADAFPRISYKSPKFDATEEAKTLTDVMLIICLVVYSLQEVEFDAESEELLKKWLQEGFTQRQIGLLTALCVKSTLGNSYDTVEGLLTGLRERGSTTLLELLTGSTTSHHGSRYFMNIPRVRPCRREKEEAMVGFDSESAELLDQLTGNLLKLQVISIVGMPGIGKSFLARKLYEDPLIEYHFHIRAWACVSQRYVKRDLLLHILRCFSELSDEIDRMRDEQIGEQLYRRLKGQRYLVVLDDIWDTEAWNYLRIYFPDDRTGSRILLTGRDINLNLDYRAAGLSHKLRLRTEDESWEIFQNVVSKEGLYATYNDVGMQIIKKCQGLPLAIVISAGLLRNKRTRASWKHVAGSLNEYMFREPNKYTDTIALSYDHLPPPLRPCFLHLGVFPEDCEIPAKKLTRLWIAEGYVQQTVGDKTLEDVAEGYMTELLNRSLVMVAKRGSDGRVKACRIHDLLRDLCLRKARELNTSATTISKYGRVSSAFPVSPAYSSDIADQLHDTSLALSTQLVHSALCFPVDLGDSLHNCRLISWETYYSLRTLDVRSICMSLFPNEVTCLIQLRYLAVQAKDGNPSTSISNLVHLQFLIISSKKNIVVPRSIWTLKSLRHLCVKSGENLIEDPFVRMPGDDGHPSVLDSLQTLSLVYPSPSCVSVLARTRNLKRLGFCGPLLSSTGALQFPPIESLNFLQHLTLLNTKSYNEAVKSCNPSLFPEGLRKLTLSNTCLHWDEMWTVGVLPKLEVLKLKFNACIGQLWETSDVGFPQLKFLELQDLDMVHWRAMSWHFPRLQRLVVHHCSRLVEIPSTLGEISTLELIDVSWCSASTSDSARNIQKEQESNGNEFLKVLVSHSLPCKPRLAEDSAAVF